MIVGERQRMGLQILNPVDFEDWDELLGSVPGSSFFHSSAWAQVLSESYGFKPIYFGDIQERKLAALLPVMEVNSFLTGKRGVSLPFTDYSDPIMNGSFQVHDVLTEVLAYGKKQGWKYLELRSRINISPSPFPSMTYLGHTLNLSNNEDQIFSGLKDTTRRNIKKAIKEGVELRIEATEKSLKEFYRLNVLTRKRHGLPPQPLTFFKEIFDHILSRGLGLVVLAFYKEKAIAGAIYFHFGDTAIYKYGASDLLYQHLRPNNLVMWEAIKWYSRKGYKKFCLGRTEPENQGLIQFKSGWGAKEYKIYYYRYDLRKEAFVPITPRERGFHNKLFTNLPSLIFKMLGGLLYKHFP